MNFSTAARAHVTYPATWPVELGLSDLLTTTRKTEIDTSAPPPPNPIQLLGIQEYTQLIVHLTTPSQQAQEYKSTKVGGHRRVSVLVRSTFCGNELQGHYKQETGRV